MKKRYPHKRSSKTNSMPVPVNARGQQPSKKQPTTPPKAGRSAQPAKQPSQREKIIIFDKGAWHIKKEVSAGDLLNVIIALGSIAAIVVSIFALSETREEFTTERKPYIPIAQLYYDTLKPESPIKIHYNLNNLGIVPVKILDGEFGIYPGTDSLLEDPSYRFASVPPRKILLNSYSIKESPYMGQWTSDAGWDSQTITLINQQLQFLYFVGNVRYLNLINNKESLYIFKVRVYQRPAFGAQMFYNENIPK